MCSIAPRVGHPDGGRPAPGARTPHNGCMAFYVIEYSYDHALDSLIQDFRPAHRQFLRELNAKGDLIASGFLRDAMTTDALIIMRADSATAALSTLEGDPFFVNGFILERRAREWTPTIGDHAEEFDTEFPVS